jgi:protein TonB
MTRTDPRKGFEKELRPHLASEGNASDRQGGAASNAFTHPALRFALSAPVAACLTLVLTASMIAMISQEFQAQDVLDTAEFTINPEVEDLPPPDVRTIIEPYKIVEVPPPPPTTKTVDADLPKTPIYTLPGDANVFKPTTLKIPGPVIVMADSNPQPIFRVPPTMPTRAQYSGHCDMRFSVGPDGQPFGIESTFCTERHFERPTIKSIEKWKYRPRIRDGRAVTMDGVTARVKFILTDEAGREIAPRTRS